MISDEKFSVYSVIHLKWLNGFLIIIIIRKMNEPVQCSDVKSQDESFGRKLSFDEINVNLLMNFIMEI